MGVGGSEDLSEEVTFELIFDRQGGVGHGKIQGADFASKSVSETVLRWEVSEGLNGLPTATQLSDGCVGDSALLLTSSQGLYHMLLSQSSLPIICGQILIL